MEFESANSNTTSKLPILKLVRNVTSVTKMSVPVTAEEKTNKKYDVKARSLLLMALPNEHKLTFSQYPDAKTMFAAIETRFGGNEATKKTQKTLLNSSSTNKDNTASPQVSTASPNANTASPQKIHEDDLEAMDLKWQLSLLSMRAKRECRAPRSKEGQFRNQDNTRKQGNNEDTSSKAMLAIDGVATTYKRGLATLEEQLITYRKNEVLFSEEVAVLKREVACKDYEINVLKSEFEKVKQEKEGIEFKIEKFDKASKDLDLLLGSQITDKSKKGLGYSAVPPPHPLIYNRPKELSVNTIKGKGCFNENWPKTFNTARTVNTAHPKSTVFSAKPIPREDLHGDRISSKGTLKTNSLDFEDVYFVNELKFNLFSVSQMCDKKNYVLFTDTECLVLSPNFKLPDANQILLKIPRKDNMYSFDMNNIVSKETLTCLVAKATSDESMLWHRRLGHINFKNINKLVKDNLVRGLPTKHFENDQTCVACLKRKQYRDSYSLGKFDGKSDKGFFVGYSLSSKAFRVYNTRTRRVEENLHIWFLENKPMIEGNGPKWLFDIDSLTQSMNYVPVAAGTIINESAGTQGEFSAGTLEEIRQDCIVMPIWKGALYFDSPSKDDNVEPKSAAGDQKQNGDGLNNENVKKDKFEDDSSTKEVNVAGQHVNTVSAKVNIVDPSFNIASSNDQESPKDMFTMGASHTLEATYVEFFNDEDEPEVDLGNITNSYIVPTTPNTRIHKDHPIENVIGDVKSSVRQENDKPTSEQGFPQKKFSIPNIQHVWILMDLPIGKEAIEQNGSLETRKMNGGFVKKQTVVCLLTTEAVWAAAKLLWTSTLDSNQLLDYGSSTKGFDSLEGFSTWSQVGDEAVHKELGNRMERAATTASSLEAEQDSGSGPRCQDTILRDVDAQTRFETTSNQSIDPPLSRGYILGSGEDNLKLLELMDLYSLCIDYQSYYLHILHSIVWVIAKAKMVNGEHQIQALIDKKKVIITETSIRSDLYLEDARGTNWLPTTTIFEELARMEYEKPSQKLTFYKVLDLEKTKDAQAKEIADLKKMVQKIKTIGDHEDASKQGRSIEDIDKDADISLVDETHGRSDDADMFDTDDLHSDEVVVDMPVVSTADEGVTAAKINELTLAQTLIEIKEAKPKVVITAATTTTTIRPKARGVVVQEPSEFRTPQEAQPSMIKDKGKAIMIESEVPL
ncbi:ribonuclease H-like domain-containing protein [Tanacetum coccineum]